MLAKYTQGASNSTKKNPVEFAYYLDLLCTVYPLQTHNSVINTVATLLLKPKALLLLFSVSRVATITL